MVLDNIENLRCYEALNPLFGKAFDFIEQTDLTTLEPGKIVLIEDELFVNVCQWGPKTKEEAKLETHDVYLDFDAGIDWRSLRLLLIYGILSPSASPQDLFL